MVKCNTCSKTVTIPAAAPQFTIDEPVRYIGTAIVLYTGQIGVIKSVEPLQFMINDQWYWNVTNKELEKV